jgi:hypothetical protein
MSGKLCGVLIQKGSFLGEFYYPCREDAQMKCAPNGYYKGNNHEWCE